MAARTDEARQVSLVFHAALIAYGLQAVADAGEEWQNVQPTPGQSASSGGRWLARVLTMISRRRRDSRALAYSYYRLHRALMTGYTYPAVRDVTATDEGDSPKQIGLDKLREDFFSQVEELVPDTLDKDRELVNSQGEVVTDSPPSDKIKIAVEDPPLDLDSFFDDLEKAAEDEARNQVDNVGYGTLVKKIQEIDDQQPAAVVDQQREQAHAEAGARQAASAERVVLNAARDTVQGIGAKDKRVLGYVRVSGTGDPCGWCAMLISRGVVYRTKAGAGAATNRADKRAEGETYHDNCKCYAEPVYTDEQYDADSRFDLNREMRRLWPIVTDNHRGKDAIRVWRRFIRQRSKSRAAQEARANSLNSNAQEA